jgi:hypothetical protein
MDWLGIDLESWLKIGDFALKVIVAVVAGAWAVVLLHYLRQRTKADADIGRALAETQRALAESQKAAADTQKSLTETQKAATDIQKSRAETEKIKRDIEIGQLQADIALKEHQLKVRKQISVAVEIGTETISALEGPFLTALVGIANQGNETTRIAWGDEPAFTVRRVKFDEDGRPQFEAPTNFWVMLTRDPTVRAASHVVRAGATETLAFAFRPSRSGLYLLAFRGRVAEDVRADVERYGVLLPTAWTAKRYVYVPESSHVELNETEVK